jgi:hypothetical protein
MPSLILGLAGGVGPVEGFSSAAWVELAPPARANALKLVEAKNERRLERICEGRIQRSFTSNRETFL